MRTAPGTTLIQGPVFVGVRGMLGPGINHHVAEDDVVPKSGVLRGPVRANKQLLAGVFALDELPEGTVFLPRCLGRALGVPTVYDSDAAQLLGVGVRGLEVVGVAQVLTLDVAL